MLRLRSNQRLDMGKIPTLRRCSKMTSFVVAVGEGDVVHPTLRLLVKRVKICAANERQSCQGSVITTMRLHRI
jgi:hypothetical protein